MRKLVFTVSALFAANAFAISFGVPGIGSVHIGEGGSPVRPPTESGGVIGNLVGRAMPIPVPGTVVEDKFHQLGDGLSDVITFGQHGRDRDKERAEAAEREAQAVRNGTEKAKTEKKLGLLRSIELAKQNVQDWEDVQSRGPAVLGSYERLFAVAQKELQERTTMAANLRAAKNSAQDAGLALRMLGGLLAPAAPQAGDADEASRKSLSSLIVGGEKLEKVAKDANMSTNEFISRAIAGADETTLQQFVQLVGGTRAQIAALVQMSGEKLLKARTTKEGLERELSALN